MEAGLLISLAAAVVIVVGFVAVAVVVVGGLLLLSTDIVRGCRVAAIVLRWRGKVFDKYARNEFLSLIPQVVFCGFPAALSC